MRDADGVCVVVVGRLGGWPVAAHTETPATCQRVFSTPRVERDGAGLFEATRSDSVPRARPLCGGVRGAMNDLIDNLEEARRALLL